MSQQVSLPRGAFDSAGRRYEREARRAYQAVVAAARESLRRAEEFFSHTVVLIDAHLQRAHAAVPSRGADDPPRSTSAGICREISAGPGGTPGPTETASF